MNKLYVGLFFLAAYIGTIFAANYAVDRWGVVSVGFGLVAPAAVYFVGLAFTFRDIVQVTLGRLAVFLAILVGAGLSYFVSPTFALASGVAFLVSESSDFIVFNTLEKRRLFLAVLISGFVGIIIDSLIFLQLAFHNQDFLKGQIVGKTWVLLLSLPLYFVVKKFVKTRISGPDSGVSAIMSEAV